MAEKGYGVQVVTIGADHNTYQLNEEGLSKILMNDLIQDMPVALVSVAGAYRGGKSFLLNFFIRYLSAPLEDRLDGSWLGSDSAPLTGFSWRSGSERNTTGILMWSEPFLVTIPGGEKVAVILMDTQGTFDSTSSVKDCSTIFALSTLLSSTQVYNLKENIREDDLQDLELFTDFGKLMKDQTGKAFQVLEFLIRDWGYDDEYVYGQEGGNQFLAKRLQITAEQPPEVRKLHQHIMDSFEKVTCFLMPHPGLKVSKKKFTGSIKDIEPDFVNALKELLPSIFSSEKLIKKQVGGRSITCRELMNFFKSYMNIFNSGVIPTPTTIYETTRDVGLLMAYNEAHDQYERNMKDACGPDAKGMPPSVVVEQHAREVAAARATFNAKKMLGTQEEIEKKLADLNRDLDSRQKEFIEINAGKTLRAINRGNVAYDKAIEAVTQGRPICVHTIDLQKIHDIAAQEAMKAFNENRKIINGKDTDKDKYNLDLASKRTVLRLMNEQNNIALTIELKNGYFQSMITQCNHEPKLTPEEFKKEHEKALARALEEFDQRRSRPNSYTMDSYKDNLEETIKFLFGQLKQINASNNTGKFQMALLIYTEAVVPLFQLREHCLHPDDLKKNHEDAVCQALVTFDEKRSCAEGFDESNKDQALLNSIFTNRYEPMVDINDTANRAAVEAAYEKFKAHFDYLTPWNYIFQSWDTAKGYHDKALGVALEVFFAKRRDRNYHESDAYLDSLKSKCWDYYKAS